MVTKYLIVSTLPVLPVFSPAMAMEVLKECTADSRDQPHLLFERTHTWTCYHVIMPCHYEINEINYEINEIDKACSKERRLQTSILSL